MQPELRAAIDRLNPAVPAAARTDALKQVVDAGGPALLSSNRAFHKLLVGGVPVSATPAQCMPCMGRVL